MAAAIELAGVGKRYVLQSGEPLLPNRLRRRSTSEELWALRDVDLFADPDSFDVGRDPNPHFGFGAPGPHFCLGSHLARREVAVAFREIFELLPDLEVVGEPDRLRSSFVNGIKRLPVRLTGAS